MATPSSNRSHYYKQYPIYRSKYHFLKKSYIGQYIIFNIDRYMLTYSARSINKHVRCSRSYRPSRFSILDVSLRNEMISVYFELRGSEIRYHFDAFVSFWYILKTISMKIYYLLEITCSSEELLPREKKISVICEIRNDLTKTFGPKA